jgi:hypothetical protein
MFNFLKMGSGVPCCHVAAHVLFVRQVNARVRRHDVRVATALLVWPPCVCALGIVVAQH